MCEQHGTMPNAISFRRRSAAEGSEAAVLIETAAAGAIVAVVGDQHPAHAQIVVERDRAQLIFDGVRALDVEEDRRACRSPWRVRRRQRDSTRRYRSGSRLDPRAKMCAACVRAASMPCSPYPTLHSGDGPRRPSAGARVAAGNARREDRAACTCGCPKGRQCAADRRCVTRS